MNIIEYTSSENQFYPTPPSVAEKMLEGIDWDMITSVLEPSAGKGDLILAASKARLKVNRWRYDSLDVDAIEIDPNLREILRFNFSDKKMKEFEKPLDELKNLPYDQRQAVRADIDSLEHKIKVIKDVDLHIIHDDFLTYRGYKHYDLILMNPPFADGDKHLLKALEMQKDGGSIVCLLNAETLRNPYTATRKALMSKLAEYNGEIEYINDAFSSDAERKAKVDCAIVRFCIPAAEQPSEIFERMKKAEEERVEQDPELKALITTDKIEQAILLYNAEVNATLELIRQYNALKPYMAWSLNQQYSHDKDPILELTVENRPFEQRKYLKAVRLKYWKAFFENDEFVGRLTSNLRDQFRSSVNRMANYEFSAFNIKQVICEMNVSMQQGVRDTIDDLFVKMTREHTWYPECANNIHYYTGWKTNKAHKVTNKVILPGYHLYSTWDKDRGFDSNMAYNILSDIEKAFDYLDGGEFKGNRYGLASFLRCASERKQSKNIECTYFHVDIFKKGTIHIKFRPEAMPLVERLNIIAAKNRNWLPPSYGKVKYEDMDAEERAVVDDFQGKEAYEKVLEKKDYYLSEPASGNMLMLTA